MQKELLCFEENAFVSWQGIVQDHYRAFSFFDSTIIGKQLNHLLCFIAGLCFRSDMKMDDLQVPIDRFVVTDL